MVQKEVKSIQNSQTVKKSVAHAKKDSMKIVVKSKEVAQKWL